MANPKSDTASDGRPMHYSVGALIEKDGKYLLIDRVKPPLGFAGLAGHVDEGETAIDALLREVKEESGLDVVEHTLLTEEEIGDNICSRGVPVHYWQVYRCKVSGEIKQNMAETKSIGWYSKEELSQLTLEPVWKYWFEKLNII